ncbi:MAG: hypothetical protein HYS66_13320, partial [Deltaproteobacteria bacterium]|nr:hypothetical protein [Deltaproteobacteria bacterium]
MEKTPEEILLEELASPKKSVKVAAIVKAAKLSPDPKVLAVLQEFAVGSDKETALFAKNALSRLRPKLEKDQASSNLARYDGIRYGSSS